MIINESNLGTIFTAYKTIFQGAFDGAPSTWTEVAMRVESQMRDEHYGWLGNFPRMREWVGDRVIHSMQAYGYAINNLKFEDTVAVKRDDIADDRFGLFKPFFAEMGRAAATHPDELIYGLLAGGFAKACYDGQPFFDSDHPVQDEHGEIQSVSNTGGGSGSAWFLLDTSRAIRPFIFQVREDYEFQRLDKPTDENVFMRDEYLYGIRARVNAGYGLWQLAYASKQTLDNDSYASARSAMQSFTADGGRKLGIMPNTLVVGPALEQAARKVVVSQVAAAGATNEWAGTAKLIVTPYL